eukprot:13303646-Alexandrium_andersonii.AAC.1
MVQKAMLNEQREPSPTLGVGAACTRAGEHGDPLLRSGREGPAVLEQEPLGGGHLAGLTRAGCVAGAVCAPCLLYTSDAADDM